MPIGLTIAALVAVTFGTQTAWILMMGYAVLNLLGTVHTLGIIKERPEGGTRSPATDAFIEQRGPVILKACFVAQLPLGLILVILDGL